MEYGREEEREEGRKGKDDVGGVLEPTERKKWTQPNHIPFKTDNR